MSTVIIGGGGKAAIDLLNTLYPGGYVTPTEATAANAAATFLAELAATAQLRAPMPTR